ncbi:MAG: peptide chain release factor H [Salibacteraceae bacterium]
MKQHTTTEILQISAGKGPAECAWVVPRLARYMAEEANSQGLVWKQIAAVAGPEHGTFDSITAEVSGPKLEAWLGSWCGTIQWVGKSVFRPMHRRKNWFVGVSRHQPSGEWTWREQDIEWQTLRASGPGGQHVNKTETAVRAIHRPSGLSVLASDSRSQGQNRKLARERLQLLLANQHQQALVEQSTERWLNHHQLERGNPVRRFSGPKFKPLKMK